MVVVQWNCDLWVAFYSSTGALLVGLRLVSTSECDCHDQTLTYECTVTGGPGGATVWTGSALNCPGGETVLLHRRFTKSRGIMGTCNNGSTVAQSLSVQNNNLYTSQLDVTVTQNATGKTIMCILQWQGRWHSQSESVFNINSRYYNECMHAPSTGKSLERSVREVLWKGHL